MIIRTQLISYPAKAAFIVVPGKPTHKHAVVPPDPFSEYTTHFFTIVEEHLSAGELAANYVPMARQILTVDSLTGGGDLTVDRTLSLLNDEAAPGPLKVYGTDDAGTKGWIDLPPDTGVTDHGLLTGLSDDDHPQYLTQARGDARYALIGSGGGGSVPADSWNHVLSVNDDGDAIVGVSPAGHEIRMLAGDADNTLGDEGMGADVVIAGGGGGANEMFQNAGSVYITGGRGNIGTGGDVVIDGGHDSDADGMGAGSVIINGGGDQSGGGGGNVQIQGGNGYAGGDAGHLRLWAGNSSVGAAGDIVLRAGTGATAGQILVENLPTTDPAIAGALWNDSGTLKISAG